MVCLVKEVFLALMEPRETEAIWVLLDQKVKVENLVKEVQWALLVPQDLQEKLAVLEIQVHQEQLEKWEPQE